MKRIILLILLFMAIPTFAQLPTPNWPDLPSPTAWASPTAIGASATDTSPTAAQVGSLESIGTAQAEAQAMPTQIAAVNGQLYWQGQPLLPNESGAQFWGYVKYLTSSNAYRVFGQMGVIVTHLGIIITGALAILSIFFAAMLIVTIFKIVRIIWDFTVGIFL